MSQDIHAYDTLYPQPENGSKGDRGPLPVPHGKYDDSTTYTCDGIIAPYVMEDSQFYVMNKTVSVKGLDPKTDYANNGTNATWLLMDKFKAIFVEMIFADFGRMGQAIFYGNYMFSQDGKDANGNKTSDYSLFTDENGTAFQPNLLLNFYTGLIKSDSGIFKNATILKSILQDVIVKGSIRSAFTAVTDSFTSNINDNVVFTSSGGGWVDAKSLPWDVAQSGRKITIVNYKWGSSISNGSISVTAPSGCYFYEDGIQKTELKMSKEFVELMGYGDSSTFYGWIVTNRRNIMTVKKYGRQLNVLAQGVVNGSSTGASMGTYHTFDNSTLTASRLSEGRYRLYLPSAWGLISGNYIVNLTGFGDSYGSTSPIKATVETLATNYVEISTSDDDSRNDGSFTFQIINLDDWT